jgi:pleiotropic regulator 1
MGKSVKTLTNHKKAIRSMAIHPDEYTFVSSSADNCKVIFSNKVWKCPEGGFMRNIGGHKSILNCTSINR